MKRGIIFFASVLTALFVLSSPAEAAGEAAFSMSSPRTDYNVGDDVPVSFSVDAGQYISTLDVIDMTIKVSDANILTAQNPSEPFIAGSVYSQIGLQEVIGDTIHVVVNIDPNNKPATRSGVIGTIDFLAQGAGSVTISYENIQATEEGQEQSFISTTASSLTINVGEANAATIAAQATATSTPRATSTTSASTGPEAAILVSGLGGIVLFFGARFAKAIRRI